MTTKVDWAAHLQAIEAEGISIKAYAAREGISLPSLVSDPPNHYSAPTVSSASTSSDRFHGNSAS